MRVVVVLAVLMFWSCYSPDADSRRTGSGHKPPSTPVQPDPETDPSTDPEPDPSTVEISPVPSQEWPRIRERQLLVDGQPFVLRAVCWNPVRQGGIHPDGLLFRNPTAQDLLQIETDFRLMREMGVNTLRTYEAVLDDRVLALIQKYQLHMIVPVFNYFATAMTEVTARVKKLKDHPSTLFWEIGNEWNYNQFYSTGSAPIGFEASKELVKKAVAAVRSVDQRLPISTVYGELPSRELIAELSGIDIWGLNIYSGLSFGTRFQTWRTLTDKPMYLAEYGADAINQTNLDEASQAKAVVALSQEILLNLSAKAADYVSLGGAVFEWNDEWWKDGTGSPTEHDVGGVAPGGGPYPDMIFNEEWWGIVGIDRKPRLVYSELKKLWMSELTEGTF